MPPPKLIYSQDDCVPIFYRAASGTRISKHAQGEATEDSDCIRHIDRSVSPATSKLSWTAADRSLPGTPPPLSQA